MTTDLRDQLADAAKALVRTNDALTKEIDDLELGDCGRIPKDSEAYRLTDKYSDCESRVWRIARQMVELEDANTEPAEARKQTR